MRLYLTMSLTDTTGRELRAGGVSHIVNSLYLSEHDPQHHAWAMRGVEQKGLQLRILLSYHYYKNVNLDELFEKYFPGNYPDVFADSGAFSAASQGAPIEIDDYADWVKRWQHLFTTYSNLDVIGDAEATLINQRYLEQAELTPLPVFHVGEDFQYLQDYIEQYQYIALGGMVPHMRFPRRIMPWVIKCFKFAGEKAVYHGFGSTSWQVMSQLPWYSVDSSSWGQGFRFGNVPIFDFDNGKFYTVGLGVYSDAKKHEKIIRSLGFNPLDFADRERNDRTKICAISAISYMLAEQWLRKKFGEIKIPGDESENVGLRSHLADANPNRFIDAKTGAGDSLHLSDTSSGINLGDAQKGLKLYGAARSAVNADEAMSCRQIGTNIYLADPVSDIEHLAKVITDEDDSNS